MVTSGCETGGGWGRVGVGRGGGWGGGGGGEEGLVHPLSFLTPPLKCGSESCSGLHFSDFGRCHFLELIIVFFSGCSHFLSFFSR